MNASWTRYVPVFLRNWLKGRYDLQKMVSNTIWLFADRVIRMAVGLFVNVLVARYLGPQKLGLLNYSIAFTALFTGLASLGLDGIVVRNIVSDSKHKEEILGTTFALKLIAGMIAGTLAVAGVLALHPGDTLIHWLVAIIALGVGFQAFDAIDLWFQTQVQSKYSVYAKNTAFLTIALCKVVLILIKAPLIAFAIAGLVEIILGAFGLIIVYRVSGHRMKNWHSNIVRAKFLLKDSWPLMLSGVIVMIYIRIDQVMLGDILGIEKVGIYSVAVNLVEVWYFIPMAITATVFPAIVNAKKLSDVIYYAKLEKLYLLMMWLSVLIALPMTFLSKAIISLVYGQQYEAAHSALSILCWSGVFIFSGLVSNHWYLLENLNRFTLYRHIIGVVANISLNVILIPRYGISGAAMATLVTQFLSSYIFDLLNKPTQKLFRIKSKFLFLFFPISVKYAVSSWSGRNSVPSRNNNI